MPQLYLFGLLLVGCILLGHAHAFGDSQGSSISTQHKGDPELKALLDKIAVNKEVLAAVSNSALITPDGKYGMLKMWIDGCQRAGVKNFMVIAIDDQVAKTMEQLGVPYWRKEPKKTADKAASNHGISAMKFQLIKEFLVLGHSVLLSDVDILTLKNPFDHLHRDEDIEALSDGFDPQTAYGWDDVFDDPKMGWSRWAHSFHIFTLNSGLFYAKAGPKTIALMDRITARLMKEKAWDQAVFNEECFKPSFDNYKSSHVGIRIMNIYDFVNSKTLFRTMRYEKQYENHVPVMIHVNYHPDKFARMQSIWARYVEGDMHALDKYPVGSCFDAPNC
uniref:Nucleotide-diphospho-sugar transferase domain-containing protein n=1 Tax=Chlamydomonas chlamydogama TaxID=225041 RepID=A0A7S2QU31_9CHLO|eukprot:CAMPEP_0202891874 /NCGR_PEP_ID=MMETSP1392-20130828/1807_1 /ASSEMBLY_ACC=CAM_ASM_000868 /TAXON_ID=225041 /ORGANISM="Chlamydomonas chlamydogama, Strain SAG 11-48b" /LENGTH=332 /DNA_ID=CAMNT_0049575737 /DNA_START=65 /DNA_END=1063 /DNA_ORIENTATION=-